MNVSLQSPAGAVVFRPWPFGPPLRGRAPHHGAGRQTPAWANHNGFWAVPLASALVGDLAHPPLPPSVQ